jgi:hypothetical protein
VLDHEVLVTNIADGITIFIRRVVALLEGDEDGFVDRFLNKTQMTRRITIKAHPSKTGAVPFTRFTDQGYIQLFLPRVRGGYAPNSSFGHDIQEALDGLSFADPKANPTVGVEERDDFVDIGGTKTWASHTVFPEVSQIPRPENLFRQTPLYLRLTESGSTFTLEGHQPSVDLIHDYLLKHTREQNRQLGIWKKNLTWGTALSALCVEDHRREVLCSGLVVVALIEGTLGYERIGDPHGGSWLFKRGSDFTTV